ncbi:DNA-binding response regulator [Variovorax sp. RO1]|uniref:response regulator n=1 Tax=Variovorax sp. RO1 TaxID=2066034 RepID=UPI000C717249|nr:response regulator transcription factor [Variovorax sp. RO1]PLC05652.1 DNA-binding response regulator [Variovorax sp. RO1]
MPALTVLIVEDDAKFRAAFASTILAAPDLELVGAAPDLQRGRALLEAHRPDVLLVDLGLPDGSGIDLIRHAARTVPECDSVVVTVFGDERHVMASIEAGTTGYLLKDVSAFDLADQIRTLRSGGSPINPVIARPLLARLVPEAPSPAGRRASAPVATSTLQALSEQEHRVLTLAAKGFTYDEIASFMVVSRHTVLTYVKCTHRKLQVGSKAEAMYEARRLGWLNE